MAAILSRRGSLVAALALILVLAGALVTSSLRGATAQEGPSFNVYFFNKTVRASNGHATFSVPVKASELLLFADCGGRSPRTGPNIPAQVVTQVASSRGRIALRILHNNGRPMNAEATLNCYAGVQGPPGPSGVHDGPPGPSDA